MKLFPSALTISLLIISISVSAQTLKIVAVGSADDLSYKVLEKQLTGKKMELTFYNDSVSVFIPSLHKKENLKRAGTDLYFRSDSTDTERSSSLLTVTKSQGQLLSVVLKMMHVQQSGDKTEVWITARAD